MVAASNRSRGVLDRAAQLAAMLFEAEREIELRRHPGSAISRRRRSRISRPSAGAFCSASITWNRGECARLLSGASSWTSLSNGTSWCSIERPARSPHARPSSSRERAARSRQIAAQDQRIHEEPDQPFDLHPVASGDRRADREVVLPAGARRRAWKPARSTMKSVAPSRRPRALSLRGSSAAGSRTGREAPRKLCTAGRGRSVGSSRSGGRPASCRRQ